MKIRVFPSHSDTYNSIIIETDDLESYSDGQFNIDSLPSVFIDDLISDLIDKN